MAIASTLLIRPRPSTVTMRIASSSDGNDSSTSMHRIRTLSRRRPKNPATSPIDVPTTTARMTDAAPASSEMRAP